MKLTWPKLVRSGNAVVKVYRHLGGFRVIYRDEAGKRKFDYYSPTTKIDGHPPKPPEFDAMCAAKIIADRLSTHGARVASVPSSEIAEYIRLRDSLEPFKVSMTDAIASVVGWLKRFDTTSLVTLDHAFSGTTAATVAQVESVSFPVAVELFLKDKDAKGTGQLHLDDMRWRLHRAAKDLVCDVSTITVQILQGWLDKQEFSAANYGNFRRCFSSFFGWCIRQKYHSENPARGAGRKNPDGIEARSVRPGQTKVFSPAEMQKLLAAAKDLYDEAPTDEEKDHAFDFLAALAICGFAGVRVTEFLRMKWSDIDLKSGYIVLESVDEKGRAKTKTPSNRAFQMADNLKRWVSANDVPRAGFIWSNRVADTDKKWLSKTIRRFCHAQSDCSAKAGLPWKKNAPRHSYCTYQFAWTGDAAATASKAGNSPARLFKNYLTRRLPDGSIVTREVAEAWFQIEIPNLKT